MISPENQVAIEQFATDVGQEAADAVRPYVDEIIQQTNLIFDIADLELASVSHGTPSPKEGDRGGDHYTTETRLGALDSSRVREFEGQFRDDFYELQGLGDTLTDKSTPDEVNATSEAMANLIDRLNILAKVTGGRPISGARFANFYFTGSEGEAGPTDTRRSLFSNFPFHGSLVGVEAVERPDQKGEGHYACMVVDPLQSSPIDYVRQDGERRAEQYPNSRIAISERTWIPIGGVSFNFEYVPTTVEAEAA